MIRRALAACFGVGLISCATPAAAQGLHDCVPHIWAQEAKYGMPRGLLMAVALTESNLDGKPYPFALNVDGKAYFAPDKEVAWSWVRYAFARGQNVDIGCMQISTRHHANMVRNLQSFLDARYNVEYGAWYLYSLYVDHKGSWTDAVAYYHSGNRERQFEYLCAVWKNLRRIGGAATQDAPFCARVSLSNPRK